MRDCKVEVARQVAADWRVATVVAQAREKKLLERMLKGHLAELHPT